MVKETAKSVLFLGDSRKMESLLAPGSVDLIITGPPYWNEVVYSEDDGQLSRINDYESFLSEISKVWAGCAYALKEGGIMAIWVHDFFRKENGRYTYIPFHSDLIRTFPREFSLKNIMIWDRYLHRDRGAMPELESIGTRLEYILILQKGRGNDAVNSALNKAYWQPVWNKKTHPRLLGSGALFRFFFWLGKPFSGFLNGPRHFLNKTMIRDGHRFKNYITECPEELIERLIKDFSSPGDVVLDPFLGSGTVMSVASRLNRICVGIEINKNALEAINKKVGAGRFELKQ